MTISGEHRLEERAEQKRVDAILHENARLHATIDTLASKLADKELALRDSATRSTGIIASLEQRVKHAEDRLKLIEQSIGWRVLRTAIGKLDQHPKFKVFLKRSLKVARWTANGQIVTKIKQFRETRNSGGLTVVSSEGSASFENFWLAKSALPKELFEIILSFSSEQGPIKLILAVNFYAGGGAEAAALEYAISFAQKNSGESILFIMTDSGPRRPLPDLPSNILVIDLQDFEGASAPAVAESYLFLILQSTTVDTLHIVNSIVGYTLLARMPSEFIQNINVVASVYALQFDPLNRERIIGYGKDFLPGTIDKIDCVVTDNRQFAVEGPLRLGLSENAWKFKTVYNKSKLSEQIDLEQSRSMLTERLVKSSENDRLKVLWAGRLDREKRVDLLIEIAKLSESFCDFLVYGGAVVDGGYETEIEKLPNISLMGAYRSPLEWDYRVKGNVFLFTSAWEGMPNTVIEAAYMGFPLIASKVGGVGELITPDTGWALDRYAEAKSYVNALSIVFKDPQEAYRRTNSLIDLVHSRHNRQSYLHALSAVPGYRRVS